MPVKTYRRSDGSLVSLDVLNDTVLINDSVSRFRVPVTQDVVDMQMDSPEESKLKRVNHELKKIAAQIEILKRREYPLAEPDTPWSEELDAVLQAGKDAKRWRR